MARQTAAELLEAWLAPLVDEIRPRGIDAALAYDDRYRGDILVVTLPTAQGYCELVAHRQPPGAVLILVAETERAARLVSSAVSGLHRQIKRTDNAHRKLVHRIERMADHLADSFVPRSSAYPTEGLEKLCKLVPARAMVGVEALFHTGEHEEEPQDLSSGELKKRAQKKYVTRYGAAVPLEGKTRAILWYAEPKQFRPGAEVSATLHRLYQQRHSTEDPIDGVIEAVDLATDVAFIGTIAAPDAAGNVASSAVDAVEASSGACGGPLDFMPDCDFCDAPDCSS